MKKLALPLLLSFFFLSIVKLSYSQQAFLHTNNIRARVNANSLFGDLSTFLPSFESPAGNGSHTIYAASLWLAGKDQTNSIKTNVNTFGKTQLPVSVRKRVRPPGQ